MMNERKILDVVWFSSMTTGKQQIGVVAVETSAPDEWKAYIGLSLMLTQVLSANEEHDAQWIAEWGSSLSPQEAHGFFPGLDIMKYKGVKQVQAEDEKKEQGNEPL